MENNQEIGSMLDLGLTEEGRSEISSIAQWARISAIVAFASLGISLLGLFKPAPLAAKVGGFIGFLILAIISLLINITLFTAAAQLKKGIAASDQAYFNTGMSKLASYFKIVGILVIILLVFAFLIFLVVLMSAMNKGTRF